MTFFLRCYFKVGACVSFAAPPEMNVLVDNSRERQIYKNVFVSTFYCSFSGSLQGRETDVAEGRAIIIVVGETGLSRGW